MTYKVLIVDDEPNILLSLEFLMKKKGFDIFVARDGREAMEIVKKNIPDLIILDIMMPEVDGYEVCQRIRSDGEVSHMKIVFLSAKVMKDDVKKGYEMGADLYITKPFSTRKLMKQVDELLN